MTKDLAYYVALNYPMELVEEDGMFVASYPDLPGCVAQGETANEAVASLKDAQEAWLEVSLEDHLPIPEPPQEEYSGRFSLRMPPVLHATLAANAKREGSSLNAHIVNLLVQATGFRSGTSVATDLMEEFRSRVDIFLSSVDARMNELRGMHVHALSLQMGASAKAQQQLRISGPLLDISPSLKRIVQDA